MITGDILDIRLVQLLAACRMFGQGWFILSTPDLRGFGGY